MQYSIKEILSWFTLEHFRQWLLGLVSLTPSATWTFQWVYVGLIAACLLGGIIFSFLPTRLHPSLKQRISTFCWTNFWIGLFLFFFRYQQIPLFGMDIFRTIQELGMIIWLVFFIRFIRRDYRQARQAEKVLEYKKKYLPQSKTIV